MNAKRLTLLLVAFAFGTPFCHGLLFSFVSTTSPAGGLLFLASILVVFGYVNVGLMSVGFGVAQTLERRWDALLQCAIVPAAIAMFITFPGTYIGIVNVADYVHFAAFSWRYETAVHAAPQKDGLRFLWFFWVDASPPLSGETLVFLVFDESDEFALPDVQRSPAWQDRALSSFTKATGFAGGPKMPDKPHHLIGHYYVVHVHY